MEKLIKMYVKVQSKLQDEQGATMVEYALMVVGIALAALVAVQAVGTQLTTTFGDIKTAITP